MSYLIRPPAHPATSVHDIPARCPRCEGFRQLCDACCEPWPVCGGRCGTVFSTAARCDLCTGTGHAPFYQLCTLCFGTGRQCDRCCDPWVSCRCDAGEEALCHVCNATGREEVDAARILYAPEGSARG